MIGIIKNWLSRRRRRRNAVMTSLKTLEDRKGKKAVYLTSTCIHEDEDKIVVRLSYPYRLSRRYWFAVLKGQIPDQLRFCGARLIKYLGA